MARKLDKSRPHGTIHHGEVSDGSAYEQDGFMFDAHGHEWTPAASAARSTPAASSSDAGDDVQARIDAAVADALAKRDAEDRTAKEAVSASKQAGKVDKNLQG